MDLTGVSVRAPTGLCAVSRCPPPECKRPGGDAFSKSSVWRSVWGPSHRKVNLQDLRAVEPLHQERHQTLGEVNHGCTVPE